MRCLDHVARAQMLTLDGIYLARSRMVRSQSGASGAPFAMLLLRDQLAMDGEDALATSGGDKRVGVARASRARCQRLDAADVAGAATGRVGAQIDDDVADLAGSADGALHDDVAGDDAPA